MADTLAADLAPSGLGLFGDIQPQVTPEVLDYLRSALGSGSPGASPQAAPMVQPAPAPQPQAPMASAQPAPDNAAGGVPAPPLRGGMNPILRTFDNLFLGGSIQRAQAAEYNTRLGNYSREQEWQIARDLPGQARLAFLTNGAELGKAIASNYAAHDIAPNAEVQYFGAGGPTVSNGVPIVDQPSGRVITPLGNGKLWVSDGSLGGGYTVDSSGNVLSDRTGPSGSVPVFQHFPRTDTHGFVQPGGIVTPPVGGSGSPEPVAPGTPGAPIQTPADAEAAVRARAAQAGLGPQDADNLVAIGRLESGLNPNVRNNGSSTGLYQFHPATFAAAGGTDISDPNQQIGAAINLYRKNGQALIDSNIDPNATSLYLAHQQGLGATRALYGAAPGTSAIDAIAPVYEAQYGVDKGDALARQAIINNRPPGMSKIAAGRMSAQDFIQGWDSRVKAVMPSGAQGAAQAPAQGAPQGAPQPQAPGAVQPGALGSENLTGGATYSKPVFNPARNQWEVTAPDGQTTPLASPDNAFNNEQAKSLSDTVDQLTAARENALQVRQGSLQAIAYARSHPMNAATPHLMQAANALRALPPEMLQAAGIDPNKIDQAASDAGVFQRIVNQNLLQAGKTLLPSRYTERELMLAKPIAGSLSTPNEAMEYTAALTGALAKRAQDQADFAENYNGPKTQQAFQKAWAESPQGQRSIFQDPEVWKGVTIHGKPAVIYANVKGQKVGVFGYGTPEQYVFKVQ